MSLKKNEIEQLVDGKINLINLKGKERLDISYYCCDCGLAHDLKITVMDNEKEVVLKNITIAYIVKRNDAKTKKRRKSIKK